MHLPAIVRDNTLNGKLMSNGGNSYSSQQQTVALLDGDTVRCCTLTDHKLCDHGSSNSGNTQSPSDHQMMMNGGGGTNTFSSAHHHQMMKMANGRHHLASEC